MKISFLRMITLWGCFAVIGSVADYFFQHTPLSVVAYRAIIVGILWLYQWDKARYTRIHSLSVDAWCMWHKMKEVDNTYEFPGEFIKGADELVEFGLAEITRINSRANIIYVTRIS